MSSLQGLRFEPCTTVIGTRSRMAKNFIFYDQATVFRTSGSTAGEQLIISVKYGKEFLMNEREFKLVDQKQGKKVRLFT